MSHTSWCLEGAGLGSCNCAHGTPVCNRTLSMFNDTMTGPFETPQLTETTIVVSTVEPLVLTNPTLRSFRRLARGVIRS